MADVPRSALEAWQNVLGVARVERLEAYHTQIWTVWADDGREYVLKQVVPLDLGEPRPRMVSEYRVLSYLRSAGVPVAVPVITDVGGIFCVDGTDLYALSPKLASGSNDVESRSDRMMTYRNIGTTIGLLHKALAAYPSAVPSYQIRLSEGLAADSWPTLRSADVELATRVDRLSPVLLDALSDLPTQLIHGDCHDGNVLLQDGDVSGFVDFEHLPIGPRICDPVRYLANRILWAVEVPAERGPVFRLLMAALLDGYDMANPLTTTERAALTAALVVQQISNAEWCLGSGDSTSSYVTGVIRAAHWLVDEYDSFVDLR